MADIYHPKEQAPIIRRTPFLFTAPTSSTCCSPSNSSLECLPDLSRSSSTTTSTGDLSNDSLSFAHDSSATSSSSASPVPKQSGLLPPIILHSNAPRLPAPLRRVSDTVLPAYRRTSSAPSAIGGRFPPLPLTGTTGRRSFTAGQLLSPATASDRRSFSANRPRARDLSPLYVAASSTREHAFRLDAELCTNLTFPPSSASNAQRQNSAPPSTLDDRSLPSPLNIYRLSSLRDTAPSPSGSHPGSLSGYSLSSLGGRQGSLRRSPSWHAGFSRSPLSTPTSPLSLCPPSSSHDASVTTPPLALQHIPSPAHSSPVITPRMAQHWPGQRQSLSENWYGTDLAFALKSPDIAQTMPEWIQKGYPSPTYLQREGERVAAAAASMKKRVEASAEATTTERPNKRPTSASVPNTRSSKRARAALPVEGEDLPAERRKSRESSSAYTRFLNNFTNGSTVASGSSIALRRVSSRLRLVCAGASPVDARRASSRIPSSSQVQSHGTSLLPLSPIDVNTPSSSASTRSITKIIVKRSHGHEAHSATVNLVYPKPVIHREGRLTSKPPQDQLVETATHLQPTFQQPKFRGDLYTPAYARVAKGGGKKVNSVEKGSKEGWCGLCPTDDPKHPGWLHLKNSSYRSVQGCSSPFVMVC